jgi:hypothetical protein
MSRVLSEKKEFFRKFSENKIVPKNFRHADCYVANTVPTCAKNPDSLRQIYTYWWHDILAGRSARLTFCQVYARILGAFQRIDIFRYVEYYSFKNCNHIIAHLIKSNIRKVAAISTTAHNIKKKAE